MLYGRRAQPQSLEDARPIHALERLLAVPWFARARVLEHASAGHLREGALTLQGGVRAAFQAHESRLRRLGAVLLLAGHQDTFDRDRVVLKSTKRHSSPLISDVRSPDQNHTSM